MFFKDKYDLGVYGEEFSKSYILLKLLDKNQTLKYSRTIAKLTKKLDKTDDMDSAVDESAEVLEFMYKSIADQFVSGEIYDEELGKERPMQKVDIDNFPTKVIRDLTRFIQGVVEKKS